MKNKFNGSIKGSKQKWGWSLAVDVRMVDSKTIGCSGSCSMSGPIAEKFCKEFAKMLSDKLRCKVKVSKMRV